MSDLHYEDPLLSELYDLDSGWSVDRDFYLALAGPARRQLKEWRRAWKIRVIRERNTNWDDLYPALVG